MSKIPLRLAFRVQPVVTPPRALVHISFWAFRRVYPPPPSLALAREWVITHTRTDLENETQISDDLRDAGQGSTVHIPAYAAH